MYALADCNNFFVSCERAFQPQLEGRPVVVLSNNDGCVVARSNESKAMGIKMGTPFFQLKSLVESGKLVACSSNYTLYGDLSNRVMSILSGVLPGYQKYSIDEAFFTLDGIKPSDYRSVCGELVRRVRRCTGIPVSIGIAPTKTLGKVANHFAKKYAGYRGVCIIDTDEKREKALALTPIDDVWGIGWRGAPKLMAAGVQTALDFVRRPEAWVHGRMGVTGVRTWKELQGTPAIADELPAPRKSICTSRSFADMITDKAELRLRVSDFAGICAQKLRSEGSAASAVGVFAHTNPFRKDLPQYYPWEMVRLDTPRNSTQEIVKAALKALEKIFREGYAYKRAGVIIDDIVSAGEIQGQLFETEDERERQRRQDEISAIMDKVNKPGSNLLRLATQRPGHYADGIRREHCSPLFTTDWEDLLIVK
ncbi:MAG: Y-family DNA polymerase [Bacteroidales bacterium]|nr:Y-family DNA polymerase [Bacteroidales bacterium]